MTHILSLMRRRLGLFHRLMLAGVLAGFGDWLLFGWNPGISVVIFFLALTGCAVIANPVHASARQFYGACALFALSMLPMIEGVNILSFLFGLAGSLTFVLVISGAWPRARLRMGRLFVSLLLVTPFRIIPDLIKNDQAARRRGRARIQAKGVIGLVITLGFGAIFVWLLSTANPLIAELLKGFGRDEGGFFNTGRALIWAFFLMVAWIFVGFKLWRYRRLWQAPLGTASTASNPVESEFSGVLADAGALIAALVLFNLIFAVQTVSDALYLWGNTTLPAGMTYADYAYRGTNALMGAALLAALFMLIAMREGGEGERSFFVRTLLYVWIGQNIILVCSAILRLDLYVKAYSLTMWRVSTFIWMGLVVIGFILIAVRILRHRTNGWLVLTNAAVAGTVLYICCFVNFPAAITNYNVAAAKSASYSEKDYFGFDFWYADSLGLQSYPAIDRFFKSAATKIDTCRRDPSQQLRSYDPDWHIDLLRLREERMRVTREYRTLCDRMEAAYYRFANSRDWTAAKNLGNNRNWREWSYGDKRALDYLRQNPTIKPARLSGTGQ